MKIARKNRASSLIATLLVLVVLSTIVVAFMQSMAIERMTAKSAKNSLQAELASDAGAAAAESQLLDLFSRYSDSLTAWQKIPSGTITNEGTVFYFRAAPQASISASSLPAATSASVFNPTPGTVSRVQAYAWPLISGAAPVIATNIANSFTTVLTTSNSTDLNLNNWIGTAPNQVKKSLRAQWIYLTNSQGVTNARYAYWIEDESFKVNIALAKDGVRGADSLGIDAREIPLQGVIPLATGVASNEISQLVSLRNFFGTTNLLSYRTASQAFQPVGTNAVADQLKFVATAHSGALNLTRDGWKRVNVNTIFTDGSDARQQLDRFITTVTNSAAAPLFGQRFYRQSLSPLAINTTNTVTTNHAMVYMQKIAANVKDYIDSNDNPTIVNSDLTVRGPGAPVDALEPAGGGTTGDNPVIAIGKEIVPMLHEYAFTVRVMSMSPVGWSGTNVGANFNVEMDHYLEFWNMSTKDIVVSGSSANERSLGTNSFLKIYNQPSFSAGTPPTPPIPEGRPITVNLASIPNLRFKAGKVTVITTDPTPNASLVKSGADIYVAPVSTNRIYTGITRDYSSGNSATDGVNTYNNSYRLLMNPRSNSVNDYETCMLLGNDQGLLESFCGLPMVGNVLMSVMARSPAYINSDSYYVRGGSLRGNGSTSTPPASATGDPRSLNEQMTFNIYNSDGSDYDQTRFYSANFVDGSTSNDSSIGTLNTNFVYPNLWSDYTLNSSSAGTAPMIIANAPMVSIGEFGHIYDPARPSGYAGAGSTNMRYVRGGGLTLHIGQPDAWSTPTNRSGTWDGKWDSASRTWASWRLVDFFDTSSADVKPGLININGVRRDDGVALKAMLSGYSYQTDTESDPVLTGRTPNAAQLANLVSAVTNRLNNTNTNSPTDDFFFWERGEISELALFQTNTNFTGLNMGNVPDRGREEVVRRVINMITTKGNTYTVYVVGQAVSVDSSGKVKVLARDRRKVITQLLNKDMSNQVDTFDAGVASDVASRFSNNTNFYLNAVWNSQE